MVLSASDLYTYLYPHPCGLRVFLAARGAEQGPPGPYLDVVRQLGVRHEAEHLATLGTYLDLRGLNSVERERRTREAVHRGDAVVYQPRLNAAVAFSGVAYDLVGEPDYLIRSAHGYVVRDSKVARKITEDEHPEILRQLETYGWLYEQCLDVPLAALEVHSGTNEIVDVPYDGGERALSVFAEIVAWQTSDKPPYEPVSWSGCGQCPFGGLCLAAAEERKDVALLPGVDKGLVAGLHATGVSTWEDLRVSFDQDRLSEFKRPWGKGTQRVGKKAGAIMHAAQAFATNSEIWYATPMLPDSQNWVMFDLEGFPPQLDADEMVFVWGMQVFGAQASDYISSTPGSEHDADKAAWEGFLLQANAIFERYGDLPFVHWANYERDRLGKYIERYGDRGNIAARVRANLLDLLPVVRNCVALPLPSYSLKVIEHHVGYQRTQQEFGGEWAMATYFEALHGDDRERAATLIEEVLKYNREDLEATWAVFEWVQAHVS